MKSLRRLIGWLRHPLRFIRSVINRMLYGNDKRYVKELYNVDGDRYIAHAGVFNPEAEESLVARIIVAYHGIEKGLTMPHKRYCFGMDAVLRLSRLVEKYFKQYGSKPNSQVLHAIGVLKEYQEFHVSRRQERDCQFWEQLDRFLKSHEDIKPAQQMRVSKELFYRNREKSFPEFACSRHTIRYYCGEVSEEVIKDAVRLAMTAPSACNRQPVRVHCISRKETCDAILALQSGNRGFGKDASKLLIVTGDLQDICWLDERYDIYTNCGIFIMNLCYALFYYEIAHCVLNWSIMVGPEKDDAMHKLAEIPKNEVVAALISCGRTPDYIEVAESPRRDINDILTFH